MTIPPTNRTMAGNYNMNGPPHHGGQPWQSDSAVHARDMLGQPLLSEMDPQQNEFGSMNEGFEPQGPPAQRGRGPHKRRRPPPGFDNPGPSFDDQGFQPPFPQDENDMSEEAMLQQQHNGGNFNMHPDDDMNMNQGGNMDMQHPSRRQRPHFPDPGLGGLPFNRQPAKSRRPGGMRDMAMADSEFPPPEHMDPTFGQDEEGGFMNQSDHFQPNGHMHQQGHDPDFEGQRLPPPFMEDMPQDRFSGSLGNPPRRQRRFSESNIPTFHDPGFQQSVGSRDNFDTRASRTGRSRMSYDRDNDSARFFGSDPTDRRRRVTHDEFGARDGGSKRRRILFYDERKPYYGFSNRSPYSVTYKGKKYPTAEHLYHSFKFEHRRPDLAEKIRTCSSRASVAISEARRYEGEIRSDWRSVKIRKMDEVLSYKFDQHRELRDQLIATGDAELVEASYNDRYWGVGSDGVGENQFGKALVRLRDELRRGSSSRKRRSSPSRTRAQDSDRYEKGGRYDGRRDRRSIYFFDKRQPHYGFNNYSPHAVSYKGKRYPTAQHLFQSLKFHGNAPDLAEHIRVFSSYPDIVTAEAHQHQRDARRDWRSIATAMMEETLWHKFTQHPDLRQELLDTAEADLIFDSREDSTWGIGSNGRGRNEIGKALERVRSRLRSEPRGRVRRGSFDVQFEREPTMAYRSIRPTKLTRRHTRGPSLPNIMTGLFGGRRSPRERIMFDHKSQPYYGFSNLSAFPVTYKGRVYPTSEHLFQSFKFEKHRPELAEHIRTCSSNPRTAISEARKLANEVRSDWRSVNVRKMEDTLWTKFTQHRSLGDALVSTGDDELMEDNDRDAFWGIGPDGMGRNEFGKVLEKVRSRLRR